MSTRLNVLTALIVLAILPHGCSETTTTPAEEPPAETGFRFDYETDDARAVSDLATPAGGATLDCTGGDGTVYSLELWPGTVSQNTTITMTPLTYLTISEVNPAASAPQSFRADAGGCNAGVWLEPAGLELDSTVVLTVTFPDTLTCGVTADLRGIFIDPDRNFYSIMPTGVDTLAAALACTLSHFSIYGTDDAAYDKHKKLIEEMTKFGLKNPTLQITTDLMLLVDEAERQGWPDLTRLALTGTNKILNKVAVIVNTLALNALTEESVEDWAKVRERSDYLGFADTDSILHAGMTKVIDRMVLRGKEYCGSDREDEGRAMLTRAVEYVIQGMWNYSSQEAWADKIREINDSIEACSDISMTVSPDDVLVYDLAVSETDTDVYVDIWVSVLTVIDDPLVNQDVHLSVEFQGEEHWSQNVGTKQTDEDGDVYFRFGFGKTPAPTGTYDLIASTHHNNEVYIAKAPLELKRRAVTLTYGYSYSYGHSTEDGGANLSASYSSIGTKAVIGITECGTVEQTLAHSSWFKNGDETWTRTHNALPMMVTACFFDIFTVTHRTDDEFRFVFFVIDKLRVGIRTPVYTKMRRVVNEGAFHEDVIIWQDAVNYFGMVYPPYPNHNEVFLYYEDGGFVDFDFSGELPGGHGSGILTISAELDEDG